MLGFEPDIFAAVLLFITSCISMPAYISQLYKILKTKSSAGVSLVSWSIWAFEYILWIIYSVVYTKDIFFVSISIIEFLLCLFISILIIKYHNRC
jgi:uncharacterized protein with PQ loop repeat